MERGSRAELKREDRLMAAVMIYSDNYKQIWSFGGGQCLINGELFSHRGKMDRMLSEVRSFYDRVWLEEGMTVEKLREQDAGREYILPLLRLQLMYANTEDYYGYPRLLGTLKESETELKRLIREDPLCIFENKGTKGITEGNNSFDDRSYIRFQVG